MFYDCISVRFRKGIPTFSSGETATVHALDEDVKKPRKAIRPGDVVLIKTPGYPVVKLVVNRHPNYDGQLGGPIVGRAAFFDPLEDTTPFSALMPGGGT